ncbi:hypothetical protein C8R41DRAFT_865700 [Lentinula lateritia]|uniref:Uncharacterized protein n=2 Tax=Lentinula lateritia TaxID=40482 RepID=A0ABQ8VL38_9AGAR|nr:hypothetical protein C8R41DRAFT_865700 [Lentinula lateritia]
MTVFLAELSKIDVALKRLEDDDRKMDAAIQRHENAMATPARTRSSNRAPDYQKLIDQKKKKKKALEDQRVALQKNRIELLEARTGNIPEPAEDPKEEAGSNERSPGNDDDLSDLSPSEDEQPDINVLSLSSARAPETTDTQEGVNANDAHASASPQTKTNAPQADTDTALGFGSEIDKTSIETPQTTDEFAEGHENAVIIKRKRGSPTTGDSQLNPKSTKRKQVEAADSGTKDEGPRQKRLAREMNHSEEEPKTKKRRPVEKTTIDGVQSADTTGAEVLEKSDNEAASGSSQKPVGTKKKQAKKSNRETEDKAPTKRTEAKEANHTSKNDMPSEKMEVDMRQAHEDSTVIPTAEVRATGSTEVDASRNFAEDNDKDRKGGRDNDDVDDGYSTDDLVGPRKSNEKFADFDKRRAKIDSLQAKARQQFARFHEAPVGGKISAKIRRLSQEVPWFVPEGGTMSRELSIRLLTSGQGNILCPYHAVKDKAIRAHDEDGKRDSQDPSLTGVPKAPTKAKSRPADPPVGYMHCGCELDLVLLEFYYWKTGKIYSPTLNRWETWKNEQMNPRVRAFVYGDWEKKTGLRLENMWTRKINMNVGARGALTKERTEIEILEEQIHVLQAQKEALEEENEWEEEEESLL